MGTVEFTGFEIMFKRACKPSAMPLIGGLFHIIQQCERDTQQKRSIHSESADGHTSGQFLEQAVIKPWTMLALICKRFCPQYPNGAVVARILTGPEGRADHGQGARHVLSVQLVSNEHFMEAALFAHQASI